MIASDPYLEGSELSFLQHLKDRTQPIRAMLAASIYRHPPGPPVTVRLDHDFEGAVSFAQRGEDLIVVDWLYRAGRPFTEMRYLDIGANHPRHLSNTYLLWTMGLRGVLVEPNPEMTALLRQHRPGDVVLEVGIAFDERRSAKLFRNADPALNSYVGGGAGAVDAIETPLVPINDVLAKHFPQRAPDFLSIDAEQLDLQILQTMNFDRWRPYLICFETGDGADGLPGYVLDKGYEIVLHNGSNTMVKLKA